MALQNEVIAEDALLSAPMQRSAAIRPRSDRWRLNLAMIVYDVGAILAAFAVAGLVYEGQWLEPRATSQGLLIVALYAACASLNDSWAFSSLARWPVAVGRAIVALFVAAAMLNLVAFFLKTNAEFSRGTFAIAVTLATFTIAFSRPYIARKAREFYGPTLLSTLVIDAGGPSLQANDGARIHAAELGGVAALDTPAALRRLAQAAAAFERVVVSCPAREYAGWAVALKSLGVRAEIIDDRIKDVGALEIGSYAAGSHATIVVDSGPLGHRARFLKRTFDIVVSFAMILLAAPVMLLIAVAIRLDDGGLVLFRQKRIGQANRPFDILKFRTMGQTMQLPRSESDGAHVTKVGAFLRQTSLDELPQLFNVLRGDMSIIGPRPHTLESLAGDKLFWKVDQRYWSRHSLKPGMTGLAQVRGLRGATDTEEDLRQRLQADLQYTANWSLARDIAILFATLRVIVHERAY